MSEGMSWGDCKARYIDFQYIPGPHFPFERGTNYSVRKRIHQQLLGPLNARVSTNIWDCVRTGVGILKLGGEAMIYTQRRTQSGSTMVDNTPESLGEIDYVS